MTVNTISSIAEFDTNGVTTNFPFYFKFLANEDLVVTYVDPLGVSSTLTLGTHYTVNGAGNDQGGSIVTTSALAGPGQLVVSREMEAFQQTSLRNQGKFLAEVHEDVFDKLTMLIQQGLATFTRALKRPLGRDYFFAENRRITSVKDPEEPQDAATKNSVEQYVGSVLGSIQGPINNSANVLYVRPSGTPGVVQDLATGEGYDYVVATLPTGVFSTVKGFFNWILDRITLSTSGSASIVAAVAKGGKVVIKNGGHYMNAPAICDYAVDPEVGFAGNPSKRIDLSGDTPGGTILSNQTNDFAVTLQGSYLPTPPHVTQNFGGFDRVGNFTIVGPSVTTPVTTDVGGSGLRIAIKANTEIHSFTAINLRRGIVLEDVLTSTLQDVNIIGCYRGITAKADNGISAPNAMSWRRVRVHACAEHGVVSDLGSASHFDVLTSEGNGTMGTGSNSVWLTAQPQQTAGMTVITAWYSELNSGSTDFRLDNNSSHQQVVKFNGGMFQRVTTTAYVGTCLYATSIAGRTIIYLDSVSFRSDFGYVPSSTRPYWDVGSYSEVIWNETCVFSETISLVYWLCLYRPYSFSVAADGTILSGPPGFGITALGSGLYRLFRTAGLAQFAKSADDVSVMVTPGVGGFAHYIPAKTTTTIDIQLHNGSAPANAKFDVEIRRNAGFYA